MTNLRTFLICLLLPWLTACVTMHPNPNLTTTITIDQQQTFTLPTPADLNMQLTATQLLSAQYGQKHYTTQIQVEATPQHLVLVALSGWGGQVFAIDYDGKQIHSSSLPMKNSNLGINHALTDFIFTYASPQVINAMLQGSTFTLKASPLQRQILQHGKPIIQINYQNTNPWQGQVTLHNLTLHYTVTITTVSVTQKKVR